MKWINVICALILFALPVQAATVRYQHTDMLGSVVSESDESGNIISRSQYEPFGKRMGGDKEGIGYTGHLQDKDLGLTYMQARYYDPLIGRFYSNDPIGFTNVHTFNRYAYANNNPYKYKDPDGRAADVVVDAAFTIYDAGQTLGAAAAYVEGVVTGNEALTAVAGEGLASSATNLAVSAVSMAVPGASAPMLRGSQAVATNAAQAKNISRFESKIPANSKDSVTTKSLPSGGVAVQATSPGNVAGSKAVYEKQIDSGGKTMSYTKTTYDPSGNIVHVKDKITNETFKNDK
ncbi:hypothetical protein K5M76_03925 [Shewanella xiamenensis]|uniref:RHS repeat-associated core domain-containing protein n=1 Tax=Shewanella xiamenensis TaxID=332186 RepID=UPI00217E5D55|nr:RHS repeat-associated core domain-containing protein [Shewanella xiamenensis]UWG65406.1 hypothetical protein K5M76_03925 [Shewanella xiamenensis]